MAVSNQDFSDHVTTMVSNRVAISPAFRHSKPLKAPMVADTKGIIINYFFLFVKDCIFLYCICYSNDMVPDLAMSPNHIMRHQMKYLYGQWLRSEGKWQSSCKTK